MKRFLLLAMLLILAAYVAYPQGRIENRKKFFEAEGFVLFEEYEDALPLYLQLIKSYPGNSNLKFRIGQCYSNIAGENEKAVPFLEEAVENINMRYREGRFRESGAPFDAYYYLANAYRINNQLEKAIETYELFNKNLDTKVYNPEVVKLQIESCQNAIELMKTPVYIRKQNLGSLINDQYPDLNPVVASDQMSMVYNKRTPFQQAVMYSKKVNGSWSEPLNIIPDLGLGQEEGNFATSLSSDGQELYIYRRGADYDGNIYVTKKIGDDRWGNIIRLNDNINTKYWESHGTISHDGKKIYFTSNRKGSLGGLDIYMSERDSADAWGPAVNLGPVINTVYNEDTPFLSEDDRTLYFSSEGHHNMGGYDIFSSRLLDNGEWSAPENAGYPVNSTGDDLFFYPVNQGYQAYYSMMDDDGFGLADIYHLEIFSDRNPRTFSVKGNVKVEDLKASEEDSIRISASSITFPGNGSVTYTNPLTGDFKLDALHGKNELVIEAPFIERYSREIDLPLNAGNDIWDLSPILLPKTDFIATLEVGETKVSGDSTFYTINTEPRSVLKVMHLAGDSVLAEEQFPVDNTPFIYGMKNRDDIDSVKFVITDRYGNVTTSVVAVEKHIAARRAAKPSYTAVPERKDITEILPVKQDTVAREQEPAAAPVTEQPVTETGKRCRFWYLWLIAGAGLIIIFFVWIKRRRDKSGK